MSGATGPVIEVEGLRKVYRRRGKTRVALDGLDLVVEPGQIHGFLGPNGSGKTTTLRALLGLVRVNAGRMRLFGQDVPKRLPRVLHSVGAVVESPQFFGNFTARRTLRLLATAGGVKRKRVDEVLEIVGLRDRAKERVRSYSLGMKQRLAVATALLKSPTLLILDEPANGLDPAGIRQIRDLLRNLADSGMTVLLSSHILSEVEQLCDHVSIISKGRRVRSGPVSEVIAEFDKGDVRVKVSDLQAAAKLIGDAGLPLEVHDDHLIVSDLADPAWITETLAKRRMYVSELTPLLPDLENVFLQLTGTEPTPGVHRQVDDAYRPPLGQADTRQPAPAYAAQAANATDATTHQITATPEETRTELIEPSGSVSETVPETAPPKETWPEATPTPIVFTETGATTVRASDPSPAESSSADPTPTDPSADEPTTTDWTGEAQTEPATGTITTTDWTGEAQTEPATGTITTTDWTGEAQTEPAEPASEPDDDAGGGGATTESDGALTTPVSAEVAETADTPTSPAPSSAASGESPDDIGSAGDTESAGETTTTVSTDAGATAGADSATRGDQGEAR